MTDNTVTVTFNADTSNLQSGIDQAVDFLELIKKPVNDTTNLINQFFNTVETSTSQMLTGILQGTQTWQQALDRVFTNILASFLESMVIAPLLEWVRTQTLMTAATLEGNASRTASDQVASSASNAARAQQAAGAITADSAQAYAGVFAFLAPELGPAAAGPAAASQAQVLSQLGLVSLDVGAWEVPQNMPAFLHAGEMVVPQAFASGLRDGSGLGGDSYTINISAIDTQTGAQFLKNNASAIAQVLSSQARNFSRNLPVWKN